MPITDRLSLKNLILISSIGVLFNGCEFFQTTPIMTFEAHILYSEIDHRAVKEWGKNIEVSVEFEKNRFSDSDGNEIRSINLKRKKDLRGSTIFEGKLVGKIASDDYRDVSFSWIIHNVRTKHIFKRKTSLSKESTEKKSLLLDVTKVIYADHIWNKTGDIINHNIMITNQSSYLLDSLDFTIGYYSEDDMKLDQKNRTYRKPIGRNTTKRITFPVNKIEGVKKISSSNPHLSTIYYSKHLK